MPNSKEEILNEHFPEGVRIPEFASSMQNLTLNSIGTEYINMEAEYEHIELFGKSALFTNERLTAAVSTSGWTA